MKNRILLFIPGYNCEKQIVRVLSQLDEEVFQYIQEVIMVNNRSTDDTEQVVLDFIADNPMIPVKLLRNNDNYGLGGSHKVAFRYAAENNFDYVVVLHGDDQGNIKDLLPLLQKGSYKHYDCCLGARFMRGSRLEGYSAFRTFGNVVYNFLFAGVIRKRVFDLGSGLNLYKVSMLESRFYEKFPDNLMFNYCMVLAASYYKQKFCFFPISWREDDQVSNVKMFNQAITVLKMLYSYAMDHKTFMQEEHRDKPVDDYNAEIIKETANK